MPRARENYARTHATLRLRPPVARVLEALRRHGRPRGLGPRPISDVLEHAILALAEASGIDVEVVREAVAGTEE